MNAKLIVSSLVLAASVSLMNAADGDKSPAESADKSAHSKVGGCGVSRVKL